MSDTITLRFLLESAAHALNDSAREAGNFADGDSWRRSRDTLRAIAPALVKWCAVSMEFLELDPDDETSNLLRRHRDAWGNLKRVLAEAGVTCD